MVVLNTAIDEGKVLEDGSLHDDFGGSTEPLSPFPRRASNRTRLI